MPERIRTSSSSATVWACTECKRRKGKCSGDSPCTFCQKSNRSCNYEARPIRLPLTRKNLDYLQSRCLKLENLLRSLDPSIDIDALLYNTSASTSGAGATPLNPGDVRHIGDSRQEEGVGGEEGEEEEGEEGEDGDGEDTFPEGACGFEWNEFSDTSTGVSEISVLSDGMASLNVDSRDVGYLGTSSGAALLRTIHRLVSRHHSCPLLPPSAPPAPESVAPQHHHPAISLPPAAESTLLSTALTSFLIDAYFAYYHPSYPVIHENIFRLRCTDLSLFSETSPRRFMYYMVLTLGAFTAYDGGEGGGVDEDLDLRVWGLVRRGLSMTGLLESGSLERVQLMAMMGNYLQKRNRPNTGYNMMGTAVRMGLGLGLHCDFMEKPGASMNVNVNTLGREIRRRTWWLLYIFDVGASITFGRPTVVSDKVETRVPGNYDDLSLEFTACTLPPPTTGITQYSTMIAHAELVKIANRIHNFFTARPEHPQLSRNLVRVFDCQILSWHLSLPPYFTSPASSVPSWFLAPREITRCKALNLRMIMYRRFLPLLSKKKKQKQQQQQKKKQQQQQKNQAALPNEDATVCLSLALETIAGVRAFIGLQTLRRGAAWYCTYFVFQAALVLVIAILETEERNQVWIDGIKDAEACLNAAKRCLGGGAQRCLDVLGRVSRLWGHGEGEGEGKGEGKMPDIAAAAGMLDDAGQDLLAGVEGWGVGMEWGDGADLSALGFAPGGTDAWMAMDLHGYDYSDFVLDPEL